jgi:hypothetical protein
MVNVNLGLCYLLGVQYELSPTFYLNLETIPNANASYQFHSTKQQSGTKFTNNLWGLDGDFSNSVAVNIVYCFSKK